MEAQKIRILLFTLISSIGLFLPWLTLTIESAKRAKSLNAGVITFKIVIFVILIAIITLTYKTNKSKVITIVKSVLRVLFSLTILYIMLKYVIIDYNKDNFVTVNIGSYIVALGSLMIVIFSIVPTKFLPPCIMHKFIAPPKTEDELVKVAETTTEESSKTE